MAYIYILTNKVNGKKYIGQTIGLKKRLADHKRAKGKQLINKAVRKYSWDNFDITYFECAEEILDAMERTLIALYKTNNREKGYNIEAGGNKNKHIPVETRKRMSENHADVSGINNPMYGKHHTDEVKNHSSIINTGRKHTEESKKKMSESRKGLLKGENNPNYGKHLSQEHREKISKATKGENNPMYGKHHSKETINKIKDVLKSKPSPFSVKIICIETDEVFNCIMDAAKKYNACHANISACCRGKQKTCSGYHWMYYEKYLKLQEAS